MNALICDYHRYGISKYPPMNSRKFFPYNHHHHYNKHELFLLTLAQKYQSDDFCNQTTRFSILLFRLLSLHSAPLAPLENQQLAFFSISIFMHRIILIIIKIIIEWWFLARTKHFYFPSFPSSLSWFFPTRWRNFVLSSCDCVGATMLLD